MIETFAAAAPVTGPADFAPAAPGSIENPDGEAFLRVQRLAVAYFSMEIGLDPNIPTYAGGLGILAGDSIRAAADLGIDMAAVTLLHREGYFFQSLLADGWQVEDATQWDPLEHMRLTPARASVTIAGRTVQLRAWRYDVRGAAGHVVPVFMLDSDLPENSEADRAITRKLYRSDAPGRFAQEIVLGVGGVRMLRALGYRRIDHCHMNEGHAALLVLELLREESEVAGMPPSEPRLLEAVRRRGVFTTHTPVAAGHDKFDLDLVRSELEPSLFATLGDPRCGAGICPDGMLNMTFLGFSLSRFINGVAKRHGEVSRALFGQYPIDSITNGVHAPTWVCKPFAELFDAQLPGWRQDNFSLRSAHKIDLALLREAHRRAKRTLIDLVNWRTNAGFETQTFTIGFARRATAYKRAELILSDLDRLRRISRDVGRIQLVFAGKAHPNDHGGKEMIKRIVAAFDSLRTDVAAVYLPNYDMALAQVLIPGVDLWLNTPQPPLEASGTSGMKAALNGVPSLSTLDGWWLEGCVEGVTGWAIGADDWSSGARSVDMHAPSDEARNASDAASLYDKLENLIVPMYAQRTEDYLRVMRNAIAINGSFFTTQRMMQQYVTKAYLT
ncbi:MAG TPA: alpha-glucan family phosphorylase [Phycisphaerales bacterium]|nr:alpha-glucan family phosphorylase [Phycisphaerales bacterium]HMP37118.1 alpha-glucan family phosphorylase [Phycisphaerales bacterium]